MDYFALSYAWGQAQDSGLCKDTPLFTTSLAQSDLPQVIEDTVEVVKQIRPEGSRYLWVDKYCINQYDAGEKHDQVQSMDTVYEGAFATIVAASTDGSEGGLAGVGPTCRIIQLSAFVNGIQLVSTMPHVSTLLKKTRWMKRGWTYQEAMLSRRCLIFTDVQAYLICRVSTCCEAVVKHPDFFASGDELPLTLFRPRTILNNDTLDELGHLANHIEQYSRRELTYEGDRLNAFRGMLARTSFRSY
jgi:Heterokaryon incompatibility protein (HET)